MFRSLIVIVFFASICAGQLSADTFPKPYNTEPASSGEPMPAERAAREMRVPDGFQVDVFAAEPMVANPIGMAWDTRGRMWIAENYTYAERPKKIERNLRDRIIILTDRDGDGRADERKVFVDDLEVLTSVEVGLGGVWAVCPPQLLFIPDRNGDDRPDGPAEVVLDGLDVPVENFHNFANGLRWGPDGWLYGRCGASAPGEVGQPGTPAAERVPLRGGMWRYHPKHRTFEALCHGTTNPWGHDWNEHGEAFFVNTVNGHLWHMIVGAHFDRPHTIDPNPRVYEMMAMHADHWHWDTGKSWTDSRSATGEHDRRGGGHAHSGTMIYQADQWPAAYRNRLLTINLHGRRVNEESLRRVGSGYLAGHEPDMLFAADPFFRGLDLMQGPDGAVYMIDWSDAGECHDSSGVHRTSGRVFRIRYGQIAAKAPLDLTKRSDEKLVVLHTDKNEWFARAARSELYRRVEARQEKTAAVEALVGQAEKDQPTPSRLRALWTSYMLGLADRGMLESLLGDEDEHLRVWAIRLLTDHWPLDTINGPRKGHAAPTDSALVERLVRMGRDDKSGLVRLVLASTLQRLNVADRPALAAALASHAEDAADQNLPPLVWYGLIPVADTQPQALARLGAETSWPKLSRWIARRLAEDLARDAKPANALLEQAVAPGANPELLPVVVAGLSDGLKGWRRAPQPAAWPAVVAAAASRQGTDELRQQVRDLGVLFGDGRALDEVRRLALDTDADMNQRRDALKTLIESRPADLRKICEKLLSVRFLNIEAARGLALFDDPAVGRELARSYKKFHGTERPGLVDALVERPEFAAALLDEMAKGNIPRSALSAFQARQIRSFNRSELSRRLAEVWGELRDSPGDKQRQIDDLKQKLTPQVLAGANLVEGRQVFNTVCGNCHRLYGRGGEIGPDLTGAGRQNLDYVLGNMIDPSSVVTADFRMSVVLLDDGRVLNGIIRTQTDRTITLQTAKELVTLDRGDVEAIERSPLSLMPDGLLAPLSADRVRDLVAYLMTRSQVPLPQEAASR